MGELIKVATVSDLPPGTCRQVDAGGRPVALFNVNHTIYAIHGTCTHRGGVQTWDVPAGGAAVFEATMREPGTYPIVTHSFADATKGAVGLFKVVAARREE